MNLTGKKILVTGADGFIGSHVIDALLEKQLAVRAFTFYNSFGSRGWLDTLPPNKQKEIDFFAGDIRDSHAVRLAAEGCDVILHLAALIAIPYSYQAPESYIDTNIKGTLNVLQAARDLGIKRIVHTSTSEVYGTAQYVPIDEDHPLVGQSPYSASKIGADQLAISFHRSFETPVTILRPFNTFGPRQSTRAVIPTIITQLASGSNKLQLGDTTPTRDFSYVGDTAKAFLAAAEADTIIGDVINFGSGFEISIAETANIIADMMGKTIFVDQQQDRLRPSASEVKRLWANTEKAQNTLKLDTSFSSRSGFERGLEQTVNWFTTGDNLKHYKQQNYSV